MWRVGTVVALRDETATAGTITLEVPDWPGHVAGYLIKSACGNHHDKIKTERFGPTGGKK